MGRSNRPFLFGSGVVAFVALAASGARPPQPAVPEGAYVGSETCAACHTDVAERLEATPHGSDAFAELSNLGCETCHGPGEAHAEDPENPALHPRVDKLAIASQSAVCQGCHRTDSQFFWEGSAHDRRNLSCLSCHSVHAFESEHSQLKAASETEACLTCHKDVRAEMWKTSHHPIREGKMSCVDCHNPHGSQTPDLIKAASVNDQCYTCHADKRGPFLWEHAPVRENCMTCHVPHGSNHIKLQRTSVPYLCQQCHANTRHPGTLYDGSTLADAGRASNREFNRGCTDCHAAVHGSNHPSSPYLAH
jgi:DmsE family decaheme c-type cytochrome